MKTSGPGPLLDLVRVSCRSARGQQQQLVAAAAPCACGSTYTSVWQTQQRLNEPSVWLLVVGGAAASRWVYVEHYYCSAAAPLVCYWQCCTDSMLCGLCWLVHWPAPQLLNPPTATYNCWGL